MSHLLLLDASGRAVVSRLDPGCREKCLNEIHGEVETCGRRRRGKLETPAGTAFLCTDDKDLCSSKRLFKRELAFYGEMIAAFSEVANEVRRDLEVASSRLAHNLTSLNTHIIQEVYAIASQSELGGSAREQVSALREAISSRPEEAAGAMLRILKNAAATRVEIQTVRRLSKQGRVDSSTRAHVLHMVVKNVMATFQLEAEERRIMLILGASSMRVVFEYEPVSAALHRIFENAMKYCAPDSEVNVELVRDRSPEIRITMRSLKIDADEAPMVFEPQFSGRHAKGAELAGDGFGLYFVKQMLSQVFIEIELVSGDDSIIVDNKEYCTNIFRIIFPPGSVERRRAA